MRWRPVFAGTFFVAAVGALIQLWPDSPTYFLPEQDYRQILAAAAGTDQLLFLRQDGSSPEVFLLERRDTATGQLVSETPVDCRTLLSDVLRRFGKDKCPVYPAEFQVSDDGRTLYCFHRSWLESGDMAAAAASFDIVTGQPAGPTVLLDSYPKAVSPDGRWILGQLLHSPHAVSVIDSRSGEAVMDFDPPDDENGFAHACFAPDGKRVLIQPGAANKVYEFDISSRRVENVFHLPDMLNPADDRDEWQDVFEWRPGELRTKLYDNPRIHGESLGPVQFVSCFADRTPCRVVRYRFDGRTLTGGTIDPLVGENQPDYYGMRGEGDGWVAHEVRISDPESSLSRFVGKLESWSGGWLNLNWKGRYGTTVVVRLVDRATRAVRFELEEESRDIQTVLDGRYMIRPVARSREGIEVWRTDKGPRWPWTIAGGVGAFVVFAVYCRLRLRSARRRQVV